METISGPKIIQAIDLREVADILWKQFNGRVQLCVSPFAPCFTLHVETPTIRADLSLSATDLTFINRRMVQGGFDSAGP